MSNLKTSQIVMTQHCCKKMTDQINHNCQIHIDKYKCPDILISYCPFCGKKLPNSKDDLWF